MYLRQLVSAFCFILILISGAPAVAQTQPVTLTLSNVTSPPLTNRQKTGYLNNLLAEITHRTDIKFKLIRLPSKRGLVNANAGLIDGELARIEFPPNMYPNLHPVETPIGFIDLAGFTLNPNLSLQTESDLWKYRLGYIHGLLFWDFLLTDHPNITTVKTNKQLFGLLVKNRIDFALFSVHSANVFTSNAGIENVRMSQYRKSLDIHMYLNEEHKNHIAPINAALLAMKQDGTYDRIISDYRQAIK